jgi:Alanine dehydrogenase/PNT, N-terminal domain
MGMKVNSSEQGDVMFEGAAGEATAGYQCKRGVAVVLYLQKMLQIFPRQKVFAAVGARYRCSIHVGADAAAAGDSNHSNHSNPKPKPPVVTSALYKPQQSSPVPHDQHFPLSTAPIINSWPSIAARTMAPTVLHLRSETKALEHRSALTPNTTAELIKAGYVVNVERSPERIFDDAEFEAAGATLVPEGSWVDAPQSHIIIGLKELEEKECKFFFLTRL